MNRQFLDVYIHLSLPWLILSVWIWSIVSACMLVSFNISSLLGPIQTGEGLSTGWKEKLGESALDNDSGVPTELMVPESGLDIVSNLNVINIISNIHI